MACVNSPGDPWPGHCSRPHAPKTESRHGRWIMSDVGTELREAREKHGLSLKDIAARTKIREALLFAMERNEFTQLPSGLLARGFFRAYAAEVGLPPETIVRKYVE